MTTADITGEIVEAFLLPPRGYMARELSRGDVLRVTDLEGQQVGITIYRPAA